MSIQTIQYVNQSIRVAADLDHFPISRLKVHVHIRDTTWNSSDCTSSYPTHVTEGHVRQLNGIFLYAVWCYRKTRRAQHNGQSTDNDRPKMPSWTVTFLPRLSFWPATFSCLPMWSLTSWLKTWNYDVSKQFLTVCFTVSVSVSMTGQKQILTELKSSWPVILTGDLYLPL
jgi:hypothetical protein